MSTTHTETLDLAATLALLRAERDRAVGERDSALAERDMARGDVERLRQSVMRLKEEIELLRRRMFVAKAERVDVSQLVLEFAAKSAELEALQAHPDADAGDHGDDGGDGKQSARAPSKSKGKTKPKGRRSLESLTDMPVEVIRIPVGDDVPEGWRFVGYADSWKIAWRPGCFVRLQIQRPTFEVKVSGETTAITTPMPKELMPRLLGAPSLLAHIAVEKFCDGLPLYRQAERFTRLGLDLDRSVMARWLEGLGANLGATIVEAMRKDAIASAFCLATDATGVAIQPQRDPGREARKPCKRGHVFVTVADRDHIFYSYSPKETSAAVQAMFRGFCGYVQADAKSVFDVLFLPPDKQKSLTEDVAPDGLTRYEVGCWSHARRKFWEAAAAKNVVAREALFRIHRIYDQDATWRDKPPATIKAMRTQHIGPELVDFFAWAAAEYEKVKDQKGSLRSALGYALRQRDALLRPLDDGRLPLDNNRSERALRKVAVGRKNWLFCGSDDHADAAMNIMSVIASARLHGIEPEQYLCELIHILPYWPTADYRLLTPKHWKATRARIGDRRLKAEIGPIDLPPNAVKEEAAS